MTKPPTKLEITWLQAIIALLAPVLAVGAAWGANSRDWARANEKLDKLEPSIVRIVELQTLLETHVSTGAHPKADGRLDAIEIELGKQQVRYNEILRRLDGLRDQLAVKKR